MMRALALAALLLGTGAVQAARIDDGPLPDAGRYLTGCWLNAEGTLDMPADRVSLCFADGMVDTALLDENGQPIDPQRGSYSFRNEKIVFTGPEAATWVLGRATIICDIGVLPYVRIGLFDCVGSGALPDGTTPPVDFLPEMRFMLQKPVPS